MAELQYSSGGKSFQFDLSKPIDISIPITESGPRAWYVDQARISPVVMGDFIGSLKQGSPVNFNEVFFNPHGHGTHTEIYSHVLNEEYYIDSYAGGFFGIVRLISVEPRIMYGKDGKKDHVVIWEQIEEIFKPEIEFNSVLIRTLPNSISKLHCNYSSTNFTYLDYKVGVELSRREIEHLLIDTPSVDREEDDGMLLCHKAFWDIERSPRKSATITELVYVPEEIPDGIYGLNLMVSSFHNDAAPSRPILYPII
jgi:kynurenine formamidase